MVDAVDLTIDALAVHRATVLITKDTISGPIRWRIIRYAYRRVHGDRFDIAISPDADQLVHEDDDAPKLAVLVTCPWCIGLWLAFMATAARRLAPGWWSLVRWPFALSSVTGLLERTTD